MDDTFHIQWHITNFCNLRCKHCYQNDFIDKENIPFEYFKKTFENIEDFLKEKNKKLVIDLTGGEIFLYPEWKKVLEMVSLSKFVKKIGIITNGFLLNSQTIKYLMNFPQIEIKISTEGINEEIYEFYRGKGNFEKFINILEKMKENNFDKTLMWTITETNSYQIDEFFDFCKKYNFSKFIVERFIPWGNGSKIKNEVIKLNTWINVINELFEKCDIEFNIDLIHLYRGFMVERGEKGNFLYGACCVVGKDGLAIMPNADVFPCRRFPLKIGNLLQQKLSDIWENSYVLNLIRERENLKGICKKCKIKECSGCRALAYSLKNDFLEEDPLCTKKISKSDMLTAK